MNSHDRWWHNNVQMDVEYETDVMDDVMDDVMENGVSVTLKRSQSILEYEGKGVRYDGTVS